MSNVHIIGISGPSCSGKTTLARILNKIFSNSVIVHQDDFYKSVLQPDTDMPIDEDTGLENWDCPDSFDPVKMHNSLEFARTHDGSLPEDHPTGEESNTHDGSTTISQEFLDNLKAMIPNEIDKKTRFVITDGILLFWDPLIYKEFDSSIFIHASKATLKQRREARQGYVTQEGYWVDPPGYFDDLVWPQYVKWNAHLFPNGDAKGINHEKIKGLIVMESDNSSIEQLATTAAKAIIHTLQT